RRRRLTPQAAPFARHVEGHVDAFLHVPTRLGEDLAHLLRHFPGKLLLTLDQELADPVEDLTPLRRRVEPPAIEGFARRLDCSLNVLLRALGKRPDQLT